MIRIGVGVELDGNGLKINVPENCTMIWIRSEDESMPEGYRVRPLLTESSL